MTQQTITVTPQQWDVIGMMWALFPMMLIFMVLGMAFRTANQALKPETLRELRETTKEVAPLLLAAGA